MKYQMRAQIFGVLLGAFCSLSCYAPDDGSRSGRYERGVSCEQFTSCSACTPVLGCGWCQAGDKGLCAEDPDACARAASFSWTWELATCPAAVDAGADAAHE
jgi:Plexin repeat